MMARKANCKFLKEERCSIKPRLLGLFYAGCPGDSCELREPYPRPEWIPSGSVKTPMFARAVFASDAIQRPATDRPPPPQGSDARAKIMAKQAIREAEKIKFMSDETDRMMQEIKEAGWPDAQQTQDVVENLPQKRSLTPGPRILDI